MKISQSQGIIHDGPSGEIDLHSGEAETVQLSDPERA